MKDIPILYTPKDTARILSISRSSVYNLLTSGTLGSVRIGRSRRIAQEHMHNYLNTLMEVGGGPK